MKPFKGVYTALVTPFKNGLIDESALRQLIQWQIQEGIHGLVACGTTGESTTLTTDERKHVIEVVIDEAKGKVPVIAGTGTNNTLESVTLSLWAKDAGADGILAVTPYYNKPTQEGLYRHYCEIAKVGLPVILYNVPSRTSVSLTVPTLQRLSTVPNIVAIKEATASLDFGSQILRETHFNMSLISGDDFTFLPLLSIGADGVISVVSNVIPKEFSNLYQNWMDGKQEDAKAIHYKYYPLIQALFVETNPLPVKTALAIMNKLHLEFRLPLCEMSELHSQELKKVLLSLELV